MKVPEKMQNRIGTKITNIINKCIEFIEVERPEMKFVYLHLCRYSQQPVSIINLSFYNPNITDYKSHVNVPKKWSKSPKTWF